MILGNLDFKSVGDFLEITFNIKKFKDNHNLDLIANVLTSNLKQNTNSRNKIARNYKNIF